MHHRALPTAVAALERVGQARGEVAVVPGAIPRQARAAREAEALAECAHAVRVVSRQIDDRAQAREGRAQGEVRRLVAVAARDVEEHRSAGDRAAPGRPRGLVAVVPGKVDEGLLLAALRHETLKMPPEKAKLPDGVIADFEQWVKMGAPDPRDKASLPRVADSWQKLLDQRRNWWSYQPVRKPPVPQPQNGPWSSQAIDRFLLAALEQKGLAPGEAADAPTLLRRLSLVLTGLPPTPEEVAQLVRDCQPSVPGQPLSPAAGSVMASWMVGKARRIAARAASSSTIGM